MALTSLTLSLDQSNIYNTLIFIMQWSTLRGHPHTYLGDSWWSILSHHMASLKCWSFRTYVQSSPTMTYHFTRGWSKRWCTFHPRYLNPRVLTNRSQTCWLHMVTKCMSCQIWLHFEYLWWTFRIGNSFVLSMFTSNKDSPEVKDS